MNGPAHDAPGRPASGEYDAPRRDGRRGDGREGEARDGRRGESRGGRRGESRGGRPIPLGYVREPPDLSPPLTRWQGVAVALFVLSFPVLLALVAWLLRMR